MALGAPYRTIAQPNEASALVYLLDQTERPPYFAATVRKDRIVALQVTGPASPKAYEFNHIKLGDDTTTLAQYFGAAYQVGPSGEAGTDLWSYPTWPFSFEVKDGHVTSIRISEP